MPSKRLHIALMILLVLASAACRRSDVIEFEEQLPPAEEGPAVLEIEMRELNASGQNGTATLTAVAGGTRVIVELENSPPGPQPIHIHEGTCDDLDPAPAHPLTDMENGGSETVVEVTLDELLTGRFAINVHKSIPEATIYVSCGEITATG